MAAILYAFGLAIVFMQNASTGGTDIIAKNSKQIFDIDMGKSMLYADLLIVLFSSFTFGIKMAMYGILGIILNSF